MPSPSSSSLAPYKLRSLITFLHSYRVCSSPSNLHQSQTLLSKFGYGSSMHEGLRFINTNRGVLYRKIQTHMLKEDKEKVEPPLPARPRHAFWFWLKEDKDKVKVEPPLPARPRPAFWFWAKWILGSILSLLLPFSRQKRPKRENLLGLEGKVEQVVEEMEIVAEVVEKVATTTEKISAEVADKLPDNGKLKEAALAIEHVSNVTAKDAQIIEHFIHKVDDLKQDWKDLEKIVEPVIDRIEELKEGV